MKKRPVLLLTAALASLALLTGCQGSPLPDGMDEDTLLTQGREIVQELNDGDYSAVYDRLRDSSKEATTQADVEDYMSSVLDKAGPYQKETGSLATGQTLDGGEKYGTAVFYCKHKKDDVLYRIAFDTDMELMGMEIRIK